MQTDDELQTELAPLPQIDYLNRKSPLSLYNMAPPHLKKAMEGVPDHLYLLSEEQLEEKLAENKRFKAVPQLLYYLRNRLWDRYSQAIANRQKTLPVADICSGICTEAYFTRVICRNPVMAAWLMIRPTEFEESSREALDLGMKQIRKILTLPLWDEAGKPDMKVARLQLAVFKQLALLRFGAPVQRHEIRSQSSNINLTAAEARDIKQIKDISSMEEIDKQMRAIMSDEQKYVLHEESRPTIEDCLTPEIDVPTPKKPKKEF